MSRTIVDPPTTALLADGSRLGGWWHDAPDGRIVCDLCPRACSLKAGDRGFCFVRENRDGQMVLSTYGRSTGFCIDPIEKKPLNHFYPGTSVLSFGTAGCNLGCKFCQNWDISKSREIERLSEQASPDQIAEAALRLGCRSVAFTYNDPVVWAEYAIDSARACHERGVQTVAVTAGYISPAARSAFYEVMDAANVDLKAFTEQFYQHETLSHLQPVLDTLHWLKHETNVWFEITNLVIPQANDALDEIGQMSDWVLEHVGPDVPIHFTAFHPDFRMRDRGPTPPETLLACYEVARSRGLNYVYVGNVHDVRHQSTYCPSCRALLIERDWYVLGAYQLDGSRCRACGHEIAGRFDRQPGDWGAKRQPVRIADFAPAPRTVTLGATPMSSPSASSTPSATAPLGRTLSLAEEQAILQSAGAQLITALVGRPWPLSDPQLAGLADGKIPGLFVSLKRRGHLRGCCGFVGQLVPLPQAIAHAAARTATDDHRFPPVSISELPYLDLEVWLLGPGESVAAQGSDRVQAVQVGRHGLQIARGQQSGLLLPSVPVEQGWNAETFLQQVCVKAGLPPTAWQEPDTRLATFEGIALKRPIAELGLTLPTIDAPLPITRDELMALARHAGQLLVQHLQGGAASPYAPELRDAQVCGLAMHAESVQTKQRLDISKLGVRPALPLQGSIFECSQALAQAIRQQPNVEQFQQLRIGLTIVGDVALHGTLADVDLRGIDPAHRAAFVIESNRFAWVFDPSKSPEQLVSEATQRAEIRPPSHASVQSLAVLSTETRVAIMQRPQASAGALLRSAAQAGRFYPAEPVELNRQLDQFFARPCPAAVATPAVMVPHAGWIFSGQLAADVLRRAIVPPTVIVISPKHTPQGVEWAVAPHEFWAIPGGTVANDLELARKLVGAIDGLQLDAAAHAQEHGIEVQLPIIARLSPQARVVGITIGGGDLQRCREFAAGLARVLDTLSVQPLLVISSDMHHFATEVENRRLDKLALDALDRLDPAHLYDVVTRNQISMCGVLPAVIVMETLRQRGGLKHVEHVGYTTSAEASGDTSRVVGYAGVLLR